MNYLFFLKKNWKDILLTIGLAATYYVTADFGLSFEAVENFATLVWPPAGISLVCLLIFGRQLWPGILAGAFFINWHTGAPAPTAFFIACGNTLEAVIALAILKKVSGTEFSIHRSKNILTLIFLAAPLSTLLAASVGTLSLYASDLIPKSQLLLSWRTWWIGDLLAQIVIVPYVLAWTPIAKTFAIKRQQVAELIFVVFATLFTNYIVFSDQIGTPSNLVLPYALFPFVIWFAARYSVREAATCCLIISVVALVQTYLGSGPFTGQSLTQNFLHLQVFVGALTITGLVVSATVNELKISDERLRKVEEELLTANAKLEKRVIERTAQLEKSQAHLNKLVDSNIIGIKISDTEGNIYEANNAFLRMVGYTREDLLQGKLRWDVMTPAEFKARDRDSIEQLKLTGYARPWEKSFISRTGKKVPVLIGITVLDQYSGQCVAFVIDLSHQKQIEDRLKKSEALLREAEVVANMGSWEWDIVNNKVAWSDALYQLFGLKNNELHPSYEGWLNAIHPEDRNRVDYIVRESIKDKQGYDIEHRVVHPGGEIRIIHGRGRVVYGTDGRPVRIYGTAQDITEQKEVEEKLRKIGAELEQRVSERTSELRHEVKEREKSESRFKFLSDASKLLGSSLDFETTIKAIAKMSVPYFADWCSVELLRDGKVDNIALVHEDPEKTKWAQELRSRYPYPKEQNRGVSTVLSTGQSRLVSNFTDDLLKAASTDEKHFQLLKQMNARSAIAVPMNARGRTIGVISFITSESGRIYGENDLKIAEDLARRAAVAVDNALLFKESQDAIHARDEFLSVASHELKTPLTSLSLQVEMLQMKLQRGGPVGDTGEMLSGAKKQCRRLGNLIDELLDLTKVRLGRLELHRETFDLTALISETVNRFQVEANQKGSTISLQAESHLVGYWDKSRLEQVVSNLISNAIKYGGGRPIEISLQKRENFVCLMVKDQGIGIAPEFKAKVFERFERAITTKSIGGLGLGLFISRQIVEAHGGTIKVESELGKGSTFIVEVPLTEQAKKAERNRPNSEAVEANA